ncbi:flagellar protein FlaG [Solibacillus sp. FSL R5-0691]|uniref:flagellar protein FlaG n=1 Tax=Solibacillus sp. FSL R5-0691 TaxID=2921653 RepID=UPI0030CC87DC
MRIDGTSILMSNMTQQSLEGQAPRPEQVDVITQQQNQTTVDGKDTKEKLEQAIDSLNEFFTINNSELKFVFHEGLDTYYAQLVNSETQEVIREIPSKKVLDVFYEMQKLVGMIVDKKI